MTRLHTDLSDEKLKAEDIRQPSKAKNRFHILLNYLPDPVLAFNLDKSVEYINPAFEQVFGWTLNEIKGKNITFIPEHLVAQARQGMKWLYKNGSIHDFETQRYTKDGRILDILINGSILYDEDGESIGQALILRDMTQENRMAKTNQVMFKISKAVHQYQRLGDLVSVINKEIQNLLSVEGAFVILADETKNLLYFYSAKYDGVQDSEFTKIRFSANEGISGRVYRTGEPLIIDDVNTCSFFLRRVTEHVAMVTRNVLCVPLKIQGKCIGVVTVVNKLFGNFDKSDLDLLTMVGGTIAFPIENTRIHEELRSSYKDLKNLNQAKDKVINHLAHELKTPASVLLASITLLSKKMTHLGLEDDAAKRILERAKRNLERILDLQYEVEDLLRNPDLKAYHILQRLLDACRDELAVLFENETENQQVIETVHNTINTLFGPTELLSEPIVLDTYLEHRLKELQPQFEHRTLEIETRFEKGSTVTMPKTIIDIIFKGILKNAVEYTPDGGNIRIDLQRVPDGTLLVITDYGIGITQEKQHLMFENYFTPPESEDYSTKTPFAFNAGGRGFDLLRIKLFSERFPFDFKITSDRCPVIPKDSDRCPGNISNCSACASAEDCRKNGKTIIIIRFAHDADNELPNA